ncbi:hypothetical protein GVN18_35325 [Pseudomonas sp. ODNR1LW]|nr:hypothetical protein [Pseudomonas sp. ODNR1LW]
MTPQEPRSKLRADAAAQQRVDPQSTRQGRPGPRIFLILIASLSGAAVLLALIWIFSQGGLSQTNANNGDQTVDAQAFDGDASDRPSGQASAKPDGERGAPAPP